MQRGRRADEQRLEVYERLRARDHRALACDEQHAHGLAPSALPGLPRCSRDRASRAARAARAALRSSLLAPLRRAGRFGRSISITHSPVRAGTSLDPTCSCRFPRSPSSAGLGRAYARTRAGAAQRDSCRAITLMPRPARARSFSPAELSTDSPDGRLLEPMVDAARAELRGAGVDQQPGVVLADAGCWNAPQIKAVAASGSQVLVNPDASARAPRQARSAQAARQACHWPIRTCNA